MTAQGVDTPPAPIESKVALPAIVTGLLGAGGSAVGALLVSYDVVNPSPTQSLAIAGVWAFLLYAVQTITAYLAPHTPRPDLQQAAAPAVAEVVTGGSTAVAPAADQSYSQGPEPGESGPYAQ